MAHTPGVGYEVLSINNGLLTGLSISDWCRPLDVIDDEDFDRYDVEPRAGDDGEGQDGAPDHAGLLQRPFYAAPTWTPESMSWLIAANRQTRRSRLNQLMNGFV